MFSQFTQKKKPVKNDVVPSVLRAYQSFWPVGVALSLRAMMNKKQAPKKKRYIPFENERYFWALLFVASLIPVIIMMLIYRERLFFHWLHSESADAGNSDAQEAGAELDG